MEETICLSRVIWSPSRSQALCGYLDDGGYLTTPELFYVSDNLYKGLDGKFYCIESWAPDGRGYSDKKVKK